MRTSVGITTPLAILATVIALQPRNAIGIGVRLSWHDNCAKAFEGFKSEIDTVVISAFREALAELDLPVPAAITPKWSENSGNQRERHRRARGRMTKQSSSSSDSLISPTPTKGATATVSTRRGRAVREATAQNHGVHSSFRPSSHPPKQRRRQLNIFSCDNAQKCGQGKACVIYCQQSQRRRRLYSDDDYKSRGGKGGMSGGKGGMSGKSVSKDKSYQPDHELATEDEVEIMIEKEVVKHAVRGKITNGLGSVKTSDGCRHNSVCQCGFNFLVVDVDVAAYYQDFTPDEAFDDPANVFSFPISLSPTNLSPPPSLSPSTSPSPPPSLSPSTSPSSLPSLSPTNSSSPIPSLSPPTNENVEGVPDTDPDPDPDPKPLKCQCSECRSDMRDAVRANRDNVPGCTAQLLQASCDFQGRAEALCFQRLIDDREIFIACVGAGFC